MFNDVYSLGIVLFELLIRRVPRECDNYKELIEESEEKELLRLMLEENPDSRISMDNLLKLEYFSELK